MNPEITITTERIDDFPLLLETLMRLDLPEIIDRHLPRHGLHQGLSWGLDSDYLAGTYSLAERPPQIAGAGLGEEIPGNPGAADRPVDQSVGFYR